LIHSDVAGIDSLPGHVFNQNRAERIVAHPAYHRHLATQPRRCCCLVGPFSPWDQPELVAPDGLSSFWSTRGFDHQIHVQATQDDDVCHGQIPP